ncbi:MAG: hypothetical protein HPY73_01105 [Methanomassiliicoccales archaeon]|nr:MAG: hypothetical protein HPY73_01105 [Methanomassiliicoccales archaeon]
MMKKENIECIGCSSSLGVEVLSDRLVLKDKVAVIPGLDRILEEVMKMRLDKRSAIADELMTRVKARFMVPDGEEKEYREALMAEYERRMMDFL